MLKLTFYGGTDEIGGNKILLEDKGVKVFVDFGVSYARESRFFSGFLQARGVNGAGDYLEFNLLPNLPGLYSEESLEDAELKYQKPEIDAILISHAHTDHMGHLKFIDPKIPVYLGETSKKIVDAMTYISPWWNVGEHEFRTFRTGQKLKIGPLEITPIHVDHSIPGAYGFLIHSSSGSIVYSGDLRLHGSAKHLTEDLIRAAGAEKPEVMLCEGTRISDVSEQLSEDDVFERSSKVVSRAKGLVATCFYGRDVDRMKTFGNVAAANNRIFVVSMRTAHLLKNLVDDPKLKVPRIGKDDRIKIYARRKNRYYNWEQELMSEAVDYAYVRKNQGKVLLNLDVMHMTELVDIKPDTGGHFIHSMSEPFSEEGEMEEEVLRNWLAHFEMTLHQSHASGHANAQGLRRVIHGISPRQIFPMHTEHPEMFRKLATEKTRIRQPRLGVTYKI